ncbi:MAG: hypothetical protein ACFFGZ_20335 [Candidatus Thorarchaeota archaeon]
MKSQVLLEKTQESFLPNLNPPVAQELGWLLRLTTAASSERATLYEQWEAQSPHVSEAGEDHPSPLSRFLMNIFHQGRTSELMMALERLISLGLQPTLAEFADLTQELLKRPWPLSRTELEIVQVLREEPTASAVRIAQVTGYHRQTIASYIKRLWYALQISTYPLVNYHALGLRRLQIWFRGAAEIPTSPYFYSRLALSGRDERWLVDTWSVPVGAEELVRERYRKLSHALQIHDISVRELLSFGKHLSLSTYEESEGWHSDPEVVKLVYQRALEGEDPFIARLLEIMPYGTADIPRLDHIDLGIIETLWKDYLLGQTREAAAIRLGISRSSFSRRLQQLETNGVIQPSLWLKTENMVQTAFTIPLSETAVLNALMCLPVVYFYLSEAKDSGDRNWLVIAKSSPAVANALADIQINENNRSQSFNVHIPELFNGSRVFRAYDKKAKAWDPELLLY